MPPDPSPTFSAPWDRTTAVISTAVVVLLAAAVAFTRSPLAAGAGAFAFALAFAYSPRGYDVVDRAIVVRRLIGNVRISLESVREARAAVPDDFRRCLRLWGSGGLFGYYGIFQTARLGRATWYVTDRRKAVVVVTENKTVLFSPDNVEGFLGAIRASAPVPSLGPPLPLPDSTRPFASGGSIGKVIGVAVALAAIGLVVFAISYAPGPPSCTLTSQTLAIHDRFYPVTIRSADVDLEQIRIVDLTEEKGFQPTARTNGFANSHYQSGWFQLANGQKVRLYRANARRLVLLPPKGAGVAILLDAADPDKFIAEVRREWGSRN